MGKTSFMRYVASQTEDTFKMIPVYLNNEGGTTTNELIKRLLEALFAELYKESWCEKVINLFVDNIKEIKIRSSGFSLKDKYDLADDIKRNFVNFMTTICDNLKDKNEGSE